MAVFELDGSGRIMQIRESFDISPSSTSSLPRHRSSGGNRDVEREARLRRTHEKPTAMRATDATSGVDLLREAAAQSRRYRLAMPRLIGPSHIDLTVTDVERSAQWWEQVMGFTRINSFEQDTFPGCGLWHRSGFTVTVLSHDATGTSWFDEKRVGLDQLRVCRQRRCRSWTLGSRI